MTRKATSAHARAAAIAIVRRLHEAGHIAYFAGGCVRDELLGLAPTDYDVATDATPDRIRSLFRRTQEVGAAFGVVLVTPTRDEGAPEPATVEVATFRSEGPYSDRRRPDSVTFSDPRSDALRRDFTINAIFIDPLAPPDEPPAPGQPPRQGRVIDFVGGLDDLSRRVIRAVGDPEARLAEDHLRALRAVRFAARLGFEIEPRTAEAIRVHARELAGVSRERIGDEVRRMLLHPSRAAAVRDLERLELDGPVLTEAHLISSGVAIGGIGPAPVPLETALAAWALDRGLDLSVTGPGTPMAALLTRWRRALCLSNEERDGLAAILGNLAILANTWPGLSEARQKRIAGAEGYGFAEALRLFGIRNPDAAAAVAERVETLRQTRSGLRPDPWVSGDDLIAMGLTPGPGFKRVLDAVYDAQLEDRVADRGAALDLAAELARSLGV